MLTKNEQGNSLIEILVSIAILGIVFILFSGAFSTNLKPLYESGNRTRALHEAQDDLSQNIIKNNGEETIAINIDFETENGEEIPEVFEEPIEVSVINEEANYMGANNEMKQVNLIYFTPETGDNDDD